MTPTTKKEIREEFVKKANDIEYPLGLPEFMWMGKISDWWLSKLDHLLEAKIKAIEEQLVPDEITASSNPRWVYNKAKKDIISILRE